MLVNLTANAMPFRKGIAIVCNPEAVINDKKVTDHHAVIPTRNLQGRTSPACLLVRKRYWSWWPQGCCARWRNPISTRKPPPRWSAPVRSLPQKGKPFSAPAGRRLDAAYHAGLKRPPEPEERPEEKTLPELSEGQSLSCFQCLRQGGKTSPPKHFTEDTLLSAMENAGKEDMPDTAERKGLGTPATRAGILEKLASTGFLERKRAKDGPADALPATRVPLITVLPEQLQSPLLTAEWGVPAGRD